mgnify:CR=1 FL=1
MVKFDLELVLLKLQPFPINYELLLPHNHEQANDHPFPYLVFLGHTCYISLSVRYFLIQSEYLAVKRLHLKVTQSFLFYY